MGHRKIKGLKWARLLPGRPSCIPQPRGARGAKALGLSYEKKLARELAGMARHGQWFEFEDLNGIGYCQPDFLVKFSIGHLISNPISPDGIVIIESKYSWTLDGYRQIDELYKPIVEYLIRKPVFGIVVCKRLVPGMSARVFGEMEQAVEWSVKGNQAAWHWLGKNSIGV